MSVERPMPEVLSLPRMGQRKLPPAPFTGACYDLETKTCPCFLPMTDEEYQNVEMKKKKIVITL